MALCRQLLVQVVTGALPTNSFQATLSDLVVSYFGIDDLESAIKHSSLLLRVELVASLSIRSSAKSGDRTKK